MPTPATPPPVAVFESVPKGILTFNRDINGGGHSANLELKSFSNNGHIDADGFHYEIEKPKMFSDRWVMRYDDDVVAEATRSGFFSSQFVVVDHIGALVMQRQGCFSRTYTIHREGRLVAEFTNPSWFSRRMEIRVYDADHEFITLAFCNWLLMVVARRESSNSAT